MTDDYQPLRSLSDGIGRLERDLERFDRNRAEDPDRPMSAMADPW